MKKSSIDIIKKQIASQTREPVGHVLISDSSPLPKLDNTNNGINTAIPPVVWVKSSGIKNRGETTEPITPSEFNVISNISYSRIVTGNGSFADHITDQYRVIRYSAILGVSGGGVLEFSISGRQSSFSVYVDNELSSSATMESFNFMPVSIALSRESTIDIYVYTATADTKIELKGDIASQITYAKEPDTCLYGGSVEWDATMPVQSYIVKTGDVTYPENAIKCYLTNDSESIGNLGGIALYVLKFVETDETDAVDTTNGYITIPGKSMNHDKYLRIDGTIYTIDYMEYDSENDNTNIYIVESIVGMTAPEKVYDGVISHKKDVNFGDEDQTELSLSKQTYTIYDSDVTNGDTYYYLIGVFDNTESKNYGDISDTYKTIVAGDDGAPALAVISEATRTGEHEVTIKITEPAESDISKATVYTEYPDSDPNINPNIKYQEITLDVDSDTFKLDAHESYYHVGNVILFKNNSETLFHTTIITAMDGNSVTVSEAPSFGFIGSFVKLLISADYLVDSRYATTEDYSFTTYAGLHAGYSYRFYVSLTDFVGNVNCNGMDRSDEVALTAPERPTVSNTINIFSDYDQQDGQGEIQAGIVNVGDDLKYYKEESRTDLSVLAFSFSGQTAGSNFIRHIGTHDRTYFTYLTDSAGTATTSTNFINYFDHTSETFGTPVDIGPSYSGAETHQRVGMIICDDGRIVIGYDDISSSGGSGGHNKGIYVKRSTNVEDISSWDNVGFLLDEYGARGWGSYPIFEKLPNGNIFCHIRFGQASNDHYRNRIWKSEDNGATWDSGHIVATLEDGNLWAYHHACQYEGLKPDKIACDITEMSQTPYQYQKGFYYESFDGETFYNAGHTFSKNIVTDGAITYAELIANFLVIDMDDEPGSVSVGIHRILLSEAGNPYLAVYIKNGTTFPDDYSIRLYYYDKSSDSWVYHTPINITDGDVSSLLTSYSEYIFDVITRVRVGSYDEVKRMRTYDRGKNWSLVENVTSNSSHDNYATVGTCRYGSRDEFLVGMHTETSNTYDRNLTVIRYKKES